MSEYTEDEVAEVVSNDGGKPILEQALDQARYGLRVFPVRSDTKAPLDGYAWKELATSKVNHVVEDFTRAVETWGEDNTSVAWAIGLDNHVAIDLDIPQDAWPDWVAEIIPDAALNITKRGTHLIFRNPDEFVPGNGDVGFPTDNWGEVRGAGGYIVTAGPDRPGLDIDGLAQARKFPHPEWLRPYGGGVDAVSYTEVKEFGSKYDGMANPNKLTALRVAVSAYDTGNNGNPSKGRHPYCLWLLCIAADEAAQGLYPFKPAYMTIKKWWESVTPPERHDREFRGMAAWAVAIALRNVNTPSDVQAPEGVLESPPGERPIPTGDEDDLTESGWGRVDLAPYYAGEFEPIVPGFFTAANSGHHHLYPAAVNMFYGDGGIGKSWCVVAAAAELVRTGEPVMLLDLEDTPSTLVDRMKLIGVGDEYAPLIHYFNPDGPFSFTAVEMLLAHCIEHGIKHVFLDSFGEALGMDGLKENDDDAIQSFNIRVAKQFVKLGISFTYVDHAPKAQDNKGDASGSKRKRAIISGIQWYVKEITPFVRGQGGKLGLVVNKDRHGHFRRSSEAARLLMDYHPDGTMSMELITYAPPASETQADSKERLVLGWIEALMMSRLQSHGFKGLGANEIVTLLRDSGKKASKEIVLRALALGDDDGTLRMSKQGSKHVYSIPTGSELVPGGSEPVGT